MGLGTIHPKEQDLVDFVLHVTDGTGADVVFEVTGTTVGTTMMSKLVRVRRRVVVVAIHGQSMPVDLFQFF